MGKFVKVTEAAAVAEGELAAFDVGGARIAVANLGGTLHASAIRVRTCSARSPRVTSTVPS
jgi:hypothetical protein